MKKYQFPRNAIRFLIFKRLLKVVYKDIPIEDFLEWEWRIAGENSEWWKGGIVGNNE